MVKRKALGGGAGTRFNDLRGPTSLWHYTESEASGDESEADDASHATGSTQ